MPRWFGFIVGIIIGSTVLWGIDRRIQYRSEAIPGSAVAKTEAHTTDKVVSTTGTVTESSQKLPFPTARSEPDLPDSAYVPDVLSDSTDDMPIESTAPPISPFAQLAIRDAAQIRQTAEAHNQKADVHQWHPIWQSFRSKLSATGFADYLTRLTAQEYRVTRLAAWTYQVELAYTSESQRVVTLLDIQRKTRLQLLVPRQ